VECVLYNIECVLYRAQLALASPELCNRICLVLVCRGRYGLGGGVLLSILGSNLGGVGPD
jgi:hypothetical protein